MSLARNSMLLVVGRSVASLARLVVNLLVARHFGEALQLTAEYQKIWLYFNTLFQVFLFGIPASMYYFHPRLEGEERRSFVNQSHTILFLLGGVFALCLFALAPVAARFYGVPNLPLYYSWFAFYGWTMVASSQLEAALNLAGRFQLLAALLIGEALLFSVAVLAPLKAGLDLHGTVIAITVLGCLRFLALHVLLTKRAPELAWSRWRLPLAATGRQLAWTLPITMTTLVAYLAAFLDKNIVATWFKEGGVYAVYQIGAMEVPFVSVLVGSVTAVMLPRLSRLQHEGKTGEICDLLARSVEGLAWIVFPLFTLLMVVADLVFVALLGESYRASAVPFRLYLLLFPLRIMFYGQILNTLGKARWVFWSALGDLALNAALSLYLVRVIGMPGPALATVLATFVEIGMFLWLLKATLGEPLGRIFRWQGLRLPTLFALLPVAGALAGRWLGGANILLALVLSLMGYGLLLLPVLARPEARRSLGTLFQGLRREK
ncbi:MAG: oligosaccharide flippase family protein [Calditrichaeota bacterium]|nr:oligosaccharide flippase family protein [Calditrichota bacterium]MCB9474547.1 oligosaccharide flippase family protein [Candidatus Delongbacteria bacterium]